jgi:nicotinamide-nucleotide amidase
MSMTMDDSDFAIAATAKAAEVANWLEKIQTIRVVFAESCTAGLVAALLGQTPGISNWLCGSAVTYRESVKQSWLDVSPATLEQHSAESLETTRKMATGVLARTNEASFAAAVTGHLGPGAPPENDGKIFVVVARSVDGTIETVSEDAIQLTATTRVERQYEAAGMTLERLLKCLDQ